MSVTQLGSETFENALKRELDRKIAQAVGEIRREAIERIEKDIDRWLANVAVEIFHICKFDMMGRELLITVDTSKVKALRQEAQRDGE